MMKNTEIIFQIIPLFGLAAYFCYLTYYYAAPMFYLKILLFTAHKKYRCTEVQFTEDKITAKFSKDGEEKVLEQAVETDFSSRFMAMDLCLVLRKMLSEIRKEQAA